MFITAVPITKLFAEADAEKELLLITAGPIEKLFAWLEGDSGGHVDAMR